ncbi:MAG: ATP-binding protein [Sulfitobacter sp.]|nr:ATP-binding protein [Sulfitobacter sp.]
MIQMAGAPGTGKTTLARGLARYFAAAVIDLDVVKTACLDSGVAWQLAGASAYESLYELCRDNLTYVPVIVDAPSYYEILPIRLSEIAAQAQATHVFVECVCDDLAEVDRRLRNRARLRSQMPSVNGTPQDAPPYVDNEGHPEIVHLRPTYRPDKNLIVVDTSSDLSVTAHISTVVEQVETLRSS